jgi:hypothetical protein
MLADLRVLISQNAYLRRLQTGQFRGFPPTQPRTCMPVAQLQGAMASGCATNQP